MTRQSILRTGSAVVVAATMALGVGALAPHVRAQTAQVDLNSPDAIRQSLDLQIRKRVKLKLVSGQEIEGTIAQVGSQAVALTELAGQEFYDATIRIDQIAVIIVRVRGR